MKKLITGWKRGIQQLGIMLLEFGGPVSFLERRLYGLVLQKWRWVQGRRKKRERGEAVGCSRERVGS